MSDPASTAAELRTAYLVDRGLLKPGGRRELEREMELLRARGRVARVLLLPRDTSLEPWRALWSELRLDAERDLLVLFNGRRFEARGWSLAPATVTRTLRRAEPQLRTYYARRLAVALRLLAEEAEAAGTVSPARTRPEAQEPAEDDLPPWLPISGGTLLVVGGAGLLALVMRRRQQIQQRDLEAVRAALAAAREIFARIILGGDELALSDPEEARRLQLEAAALENELESLERVLRDAGPRHDYGVTLGKIRQLEHQLRVLASTLLQERRRTDAQEPHQDRPAER